MARYSQTGLEGFGASVNSIRDGWNLRQTLRLLEKVLHPAGVAVYFCEEESLSSCERIGTRSSTRRVPSARAAGGRAPLRSGE
jgi:hypothetical protein